jgi:F0F1-type ATP synthase assembly protein I
MEPNNERSGADEFGDSADGKSEHQDVPQIPLPSTPKFPPPPEVNYTRPALKKGEYALHPDLQVGVSDEQNRVNTVARMGSGMSAGITFASSVIVSVLIGMWIDRRFEPNATPWATIVMTLLGFVAGYMTFLRISSASDRNIKRGK